MYVSFSYVPYISNIRTQQAYDGHMNLILSDVEESIMIVDAEDDNQPLTQGRIKVSSS